MSGRRADRGWLVLGAYVVGHNVLAAGRGDEMLSHAFDRWMATRRLKWVLYAVVGSIALHLVNLMPVRLDWLGAVMGAIARKVGPLT
ncbi:DUF7427 family protein [Mycolicibacterium llatzerense]|uniref:DUF7427 family protein n=1 Tax=Mycolicibacterium llatzerense TaxID=280871 RepID=UPI0021B5990C|nr:hypothetical protein [Mycolicibacterium llatzerense]MCT7361274.1 hypothetical protein [Mycolicibacterium llatzerense]